MPVDINHMNTYDIKPATTEDLVYQAFPAHAVKISGEPSYNALHLLRTTSFENAASVNSKLGGGTHGHIGMVMSDDTYASIAPIAWIDPEEPPVAPTIPIGATRPQISEANRAHAQSLRERREFQNLDCALLRLVTESIKPLYQ